MTYFEMIREIREDWGYTQTQVAAILHVGQRTYSDYESGRTRIPVDSLIILARFYNLDLNYITGVSSCQCKYPVA